MSPSYRMAFAVALFCTLNIIITETYFLDDLKPQIMHNYVMDKRASNLGGRMDVFLIARLMENLVDEKSDIHPISEYCSNMIDSLEGIH
ncbi:uncharacterized protein isoform X3 [Rhodnius prolixus]|uniref:uncharacterized protein isoform X3 n=1 Tax=Rhodnius prolixus TaxID=13249 RepID=UPI003D18C716